MNVGEGPDGDGQAQHREQHAAHAAASMAHGEPPCSRKESCELLVASKKDKGRWLATNN
jgi:hypothetical protein